MLCWWLSVGWLVVLGEATPFPWRSTARHVKNQKKAAKSSHEHIIFKITRMLSAILNSASSCLSFCFLLLLLRSLDHRSVFLGTNFRSLSQIPCHGSSRLQTALLSGCKSAWLATPPQQQQHEEAAPRSTAAGSHPSILPVLQKHPHCTCYRWTCCSCSSRGLDPCSCQAHRQPVTLSAAAAAPNPADCARASPRLPVSSAARH